MQSKYGEFTTFKTAGVHSQQTAAFVWNWSDSKSIFFVLIDFQLSFLSNCSASHKAMLL